MFDGYAGISASGFAAEVATEEAVAMLDYAEELYRDWNDGGRAGGGATARVDAGFTRIRREPGDLPGVIANPTRLRTMLGHLTKPCTPACSTTASTNRPQPYAPNASTPPAGRCRYSTRAPPARTPAAPAPTCPA
jgi:hypothetical protein